MKRIISGILFLVFTIVANVFAEDEVAKTNSPVGWKPHLAITLDIGPVSTYFNLKPDGTVSADSHFDLKMTPGLEWRFSDFLFAGFTLSPITFGFGMDSVMPGIIPAVVLGWGDPQSGMAGSLSFGKDVYSSKPVFCPDSYLLAAHLYICDFRLGISSIYQTAYTDPYGPSGSFPYPVILKFFLEVGWSFRL